MATLTLDLDDADGQFEKMVDHIRRTAAIGHSFEVVVDPGDSDHEKKFFFDGDGAFRIRADNAEDGETTLIDAEGGDKAAAIRAKIKKLKRDPKNARNVAELEDELKMIEADKGSSKTDGEVLMDALSTLRGRIEVAASKK